MLLKAQERVLRFDSDYPSSVRPDPAKAFLKVLDNEDQVLVEQFDVIDVLPANYWGGNLVSQSCYIIVKPNGLYVKSWSS